MTAMLTRSTPSATTSEEDPARQRELDLIRRAQAGCTASRNALIEGLLPLVRRLAAQQSYSRSDTEDLASEGVLALMRAIDGFDPEMGVRLGAYATPWMIHAMRGAQMAAMRMVRLPARDEAMRRRVVRAVGRLRGASGETPTAPEIAAELGIPVHTAAQVMDRMRATVFSGTDAGADLLEGAWESGLASGSSVLSDVAAHREQIGALLAALPATEREIVCGAFGIGCGRPSTVRELARRFSLPADQVDARLQKGLSRLRIMAGAA
ncbi:MAG: sigma-70 family RNA polymerase sigma factor [Phycisphaerales bacterium]|nr:sigma-70 family RNA polymerase sigma factor [Phycisphaerales bacterium]